jgi:hypothetical protein
MRLYYRCATNEHKNTAGMGKHRQVKNDTKPGFAGLIALKHPVVALIQLV